MNVTTKTVAVMLLAVCAVCGSPAGRRAVFVGGAVPKPGPVDFVDNGMTIDSAMSGVGMDLSPFYAKEGVANEGSRCPIRIEIIRQGEKKTYDPRVDTAVLRGLPVKLDDIITVKDFRLYPKMLEDQKQDIDQSLWLGSSSLADQLRLLADTQHEYEEWLGDSGKAARTSDECLKAEAARLVKEGKGQKIVDLLSMRLGSLQLHGLGPAHPVVKSLGSLIQIFKDLNRQMSEAQVRP